MFHSEDGLLLMLDEKHTIVHSFNTKNSWVYKECMNVTNTK